MSTQPGVGAGRAGVVVLASVVLLLPPTVAVAVPPAVDVVLASALPDGTTGNGVSGTFGVAMSGDGGAVAFSSSVSDLHPGDGDTDLDVYVKHLRTGELVLASVNGDGTKGNRLSLRPSLDADGGRVAFVSGADNLDPADPDEFADVYVKDLTSGVLHLASTDATGGKGRGDSTGPSLSADGGAVAFVSKAPGLLPEVDDDALADVFLKDLVTGALRLVSTTADGRKGRPGPYGVGEVSLSADGSRVAFDTDASLDDRDTDAAPDVYVKDLRTGELLLASLSADGTNSAGGSYRPSLSGDGSSVAFDSSSVDLSPDDVDEDADVYVKDLADGSLVLVSRTAHAKADARSTDASLSSDGRRVAFSSNATNLADGDTTDTLDTYVKDLDTGRVTLASATPDGRGAGALSISPSLSGDGSAVAFATPADDLGPSDVNGRADVYVRRLATVPDEPPEDDAPPVVRLSVTPTQVSSRTAVTVTLTGDVVDAGTGVASVRVDVQDEYGHVMPTVVPVDGAGGARVSFTRCFSLPGSLRQQDPDGREYTITAVATDLAGNSATEHVHVVVHRHRSDVDGTTAVTALRTLTRRGRSGQRPATSASPRNHDRSRAAETARRTEGKTL